MSQFDLSKINYAEVCRQDYQMAVLPWGATEPHNRHLPYLTDCILSQEIALLAARTARHTYGINCMVLPPVPFGSQNPGQRDLPFCIHARYETQKAILTDIVASLHHQGMRRLVIINGHGGNSFKNMIRDLAVDYPDMLIASSEWFSVCKASEFFEEPGEHADEIETSVMMYFHPELARLEEAGSGESKPFATQSLNEKIAWIPRNWLKVTYDTGIGNPAKSTAAKGERFALAAAEKYARLFNDLVNGEIYLP